MKALIVYWHPEPQSFNHAMFETAKTALEAASFDVMTSDLHKMAFEAASSRDNFKSVHDADYLKLQLEELHATKSGTFSDVIETEIAKIEACDLMIWQFPLWWFGLPAVLKGWVDRTFALGRVYSHSKSFENGVFKGKRAMLSTTTGGTIDSYTQGGFAGDLVEILRPIHRGMLKFTGFDVLQPHMVYGPVRMTGDAREAELARYAKRLSKIMSEDPIDVPGF